MIKAALYLVFETIPFPNSSKIRRLPSKPCIEILVYLPQKINCLCFTLCSNFLCHHPFFVELTSFFLPSFRVFLILAKGCEFIRIRNEAGRGNQERTMTKIIVLRPFTENLAKYLDRNTVSPMSKSNFRIFF